MKDFLSSLQLCSLSLFQHNPVYLFNVFFFLAVCCCRTTWGSNQYTQGAYSYVAVGGTAQEMETLGEPLMADNGKVCVQKLRVKTVLSLNWETKQQ